MSSLFAAPLFGETLFGDGSATATEITASEQVKYTLELRSRAGSLVAYLPLWKNATVKQNLNNAGNLSFDYPALAEDADLVKFPNQVWVRNHKQEIIDKYVILPHTVTMNDVSYTRAIEGESLFVQWQREIVTSYEKTDVDAFTIKQIVKDLLAFQVQSTKIHYGYIDPSISSLVRAVNFEGKNLLSCIQDLYASVNIGHMWISPSNQFYWKLRQGESKGQEIRLRKNMKGIRIKEDATQIINRVYIYGEGIGGARLTLIDAGLSNEYKDNASSISTYGIIPARFVYKDVSSPSLLEDYADVILEENADSKITYEVDFLALDQADYTNFSFEEIKLGSKIRLVNEDLNVSSYQWVVGIEKSLDAPLIQKLTLSDFPPSFESVAEEIQERLTTLENAEDGFEDSVAEVIESFPVVQEAIAEAITNNETIINNIENIVNETAAAAVAEELGMQNLDNVVRMFNVPTATDLADIATDTGITPRSRDFAWTEDALQLYKMDESEGWTLVDHYGAKIYTATDKASLPLSVANGSLGMTTGGTKNIYCKIDGVWRSMWLME